MGRIIDRRRVMGGKNLPYDAEIEYLESSGTQYIDTGVGTSDFERCECTIVVQFTNTDGRQLTGATDGFYFGVNTRLWESAYKRYMSGEADFNKHTFIKVLDKTLNKHLFYIDGVLKDDWSESVLDSQFKYNFYLFACAENGPVGYSSYKLYSAKIYVNGDLKFDGFPVVKNNIGYMYDKVSGQLFGNAGTGDFILGPDK